MHTHDTDDELPYPPLTERDVQAIRQHEPQRRGRVVSSLLAAPGCHRPTPDDTDMGDEASRYLGSKR